MSPRFLALFALVLMGCPTTTPCPDGQVYDGTRCVDVDVDGGSGEDAPCGGGCSAPQVCNVATSECVECLGDDASSCPTAGDNACVDETCVACDDDTDCESLDAAQCDTTTHACVACTDSAACAGRSGTEVCSAGTCVECSADDESACTAGVCDVLMGTCTTRPPGLTSPCRPCVNDRQCAEGLLCVPTRFPVGGPVVGNHCAWREDAAAPGPMGACSRVPPHVRGVMETSVNGVAAMVCVPRISTCEALADFSGTVCSSPGTTPSPMCGADSVDDGFCQMLDAGTNRCTVECSSNDDCPCTGVTCARQYRCNTGLCDLGCDCLVGGGACTGTCP